MWRATLISFWGMKPHLSIYWLHRVRCIYHLISWYSFRNTPSFVTTLGHTYHSLRIVTHIKEQPFVRCPLRQQFFWKFFHSARLSSQETFFNVWLWNTEPFFIECLYDFSSDFIIFFFKVWALVNNIKWCIFTFSLLNDRGQVCSRPYDHWNALFDDSSLVTGDLLSSVA